jgi:anti-sigma B factor antagonist
VLVRLQGELDLYNAPLLAGIFECECANRPERLALELSAVEFVDSTALHTLVASRKLLSNWRGLIVVAPTRLVRESLEMSGVDRLLAIRDCVDDAELATVRRGSAQ